MATHLGKEGTVQVGSNSIAEIRSFSIDETVDTVEILQWAMLQNHT